MVLSLSSFMVLPSLYFTFSTLLPPPFSLLPLLSILVIIDITNESVILTVCVSLYPRRCYPY